MVRRLILISILSVAALGVRAQTLAYGAGEELVFVVSYKAKMWFNTDVGQVVMSVSDDRAENVPALKITARATVYNFFKMFFNLNDTYRVWIDADRHLPLRFESDIREGGYRFTSNFVYDWHNMRVDTRYCNQNRYPEGKQKSMALDNGVMDGVSLFYAMRSLDFSQLTAGRTHKLKLLLEDTVRTINYRFLGQEELATRDFGTLATCKFACQLATSEGESFDDGSEFYLWVTDDENRTPVYVESPIRVGSVRARLVSYKNLKHSDNAFGSD